MDTLVGYSPVEPKIISEKEMTHLKSLGVDIYYNAFDAIAVLCEKQENGLYRFSIAHSTPAYSFARRSARKHIDADIEGLT